MNLLEIIKTRRSIRRYTDTPVDDKSINIVIEAARWAPSCANTQCCRFIVVKNEETRSKLAETLIPENPSIRAVRQAPVVIVSCAELGKSGFYEGKPTSDKGDWYMFDVALATQNLTLAAHSLGLGTGHISAFDAQKVAQILKVPQGVAVVEIIPLGYPEKVGKAPPRKELSEIVFYEAYGQS